MIFLFGLTGVGHSPSVGREDPRRRVDHILTEILASLNRTLDILGQLGIQLTPAQYGQHTVVVISEVSQGGLIS